MTKTRNNHYVPQWYQEGFFEPGRTTYAYLDLTPKQHARCLAKRDVMRKAEVAAYLQNSL